MPEGPTAQLERFAAKLGLSPSGQKSFLSALCRGNSGRTALAATPSAPSEYTPPFPPERERPAWVPDGVLIPRPEEGEDFKPGAHEDYSKGFYYPLDLSSIWETTPLGQLDLPRRCLDLCASPGGKTILAQIRLHPAFHIANEIHSKRLGIMRSNLARTGFHSLYTQRLRPDQWATIAPESFDLLLVDAPCSGQSLAARGIENPGCFHPSTIKGNAKRQRGILTNAIRTLAPGGHLLYTTCTFAPDENEKTIAYILKRYGNIKAVAVPALEQFQSPLAGFPCYRLLPGSGWGSGGFSCLLEKEGSSPHLPELAQELLAWPVSGHDKLPS